MGKSVKKNFIWNALYQVFLVILPLITTPYVSRVLGSDGIGTYSFTYSITTYFVLFGTLGVALYGRREIAYLQKDKETRTQTFWQINIIKWITMAISMFVFWLTMARTGDRSLYYKIFSIELISNAIDISWYFQGLEEFKLVAIRNFIIKIALTAAIFIFVRSHDDLWLYILIFCVSNLLSNLSLWFMLPKTIEKGRPHFKGAQKHLLPILSMFLPQITVEIYTVLDRTMIGLLYKDMNEVGIYEQSQKIEKMSLSLVTSIGPVMATHVSSLLSEGKREEAKDDLLKVFHFIWVMATPIAFGIIGIAENLVPWFLGPNFTKAIGVMQIGAILIFAIGLSNAIGHQYLVPTRQNAAFTGSVTAGAVSNFFMNLFLIPRFGAYGAIVASVIAEWIVTSVQLHFAKKDIKIHEIFAPAAKAVPVGIIMCLIVIALGKVLPSNIFGTIAQVIVGGGFYILVMFLIKDSVVLDMFESIKRFAKRFTHKS